MLRAASLPTDGPAAEQLKPPQRAPRTNARNNAPGGNRVHTGVGPCQLERAASPINHAYTFRYRGHGQVNARKLGRKKPSRCGSLPSTSFFFLETGSSEPISVSAMILKVPALRCYSPWDRLPSADSDGTTPSSTLFFSLPGFVHAIRYPRRT